MNCRRLAVIVILPGILVHAWAGAHAADPTHRQATATATILPIVTTHDVAGRGRTGKSSESGTAGSTTIKYIDDEGFVTSAANPRHRTIIITDLP